MLWLVTHGQFSLSLLLETLLEKVCGLEPMVRDDALMQSFKKIKLKASNLVTVDKRRAGPGSAFACILTSHAGICEFQA